MTSRLAKVNSLVKSEAGRALASLLAYPGALATITTVETAPDLRSADVWISLVPDDDEAWEAVLEQRLEVQAAMAERLAMKRTPVLRLRRDKGGAYARHIEDLLQEL